MPTSILHSFFSQIWSDDASCRAGSKFKSGLINSKEGRGIEPNITEFGR